MLPSTTSTGSTHLIVMRSRLHSNKRNLSNKTAACLVAPELVENAVSSESRLQLPCTQDSPLGSRSFASCGISTKPKPTAKSNSPWLPPCLVWTNDAEEMIEVIECLREWIPSQSTGLQKLTQSCAAYGSGDEVIARIKRAASPLLKRSKHLRGSPKATVR